MIIKSPLALDSTGLLIGVNRLYTPGDQRTICRPYIDGQGLLKFRGHGEGGDQRHYKHFPYVRTGAVAPGLLEAATRITGLCQVTIKQSCLNPICGDPQNPDCCNDPVIAVSPPDVFGRDYITCGGMLIYPNGTDVTFTVVPVAEVCYPWYHYFTRAVIDTGCGFGFIVKTGNPFTFHTPDAQFCTAGELCYCVVDLIYEAGFGCPEICDECSGQAPLYIQGTSASGWPKNYPDGCDDWVDDIQAARDAAGGIGASCCYTDASCAWHCTTLPCGDCPVQVVGSSHGETITAWFAATAWIKPYWPCGPTGANRVGLDFGVGAGFTLYVGQGIGHCIDQPAGWDFGWGHGFSPRSPIDIGAATTAAQACMMARNAIAGSYGGTLHGKSYGFNVQV